MFVSEQVGDPDLDDRVPVGSFILALRPSARKSLPDASGKKNGSLPVTRLDPVSPTTSSDVVLLDTSKNDVEMSVSKNLRVPLQQVRSLVLIRSRQDFWSDFPLILE